MKTVEEIIDYLEALEQAYDEENKEALYRQTLCGRNNRTRSPEIIQEDYWFCRKILGFIRQEDKKWVIGLMLEGTLK